MNFALSGTPRNQTQTLFKSGISTVVGSPGDREATRVISPGASGADASEVRYHQNNLIQQLVFFERTELELIEPGR